ncbi:MAG: hypothetical protein ACKVHO_16030, partial [Verrucomicrobiia bacterium]
MTKPKAFVKILHGLAGHCYHFRRNRLFGKLGRHCAHRCKVSDVMGRLKPAYLASEAMGMVVRPQSSL